MWFVRTVCCLCDVRPSSLIGVLLPTTPQYFNNRHFSFRANGDYEKLMDWSMNEKMNANGFGRRWVWALGPLTIFLTDIRYYPYPRTQNLYTPYIQFLRSLFLKRTSTKAYRRFQSRKYVLFLKKWPYLRVFD